MPVDGYEKSGNDYVKDHNGEIFASESMGNAIKAERAKQNASGGGGFIGGIANSPLVAKLLGGLILFTAIGFLYIRYALYINTIILVVILKFVFGFLAKRIEVLGRIPKKLVSLGLIAVLIIGFIISSVYYSSALDRAYLGNDRIVEQKDGKPVSVYKNPENKGKEIASLKAGTDVRVFGVTRDRGYFKIQTPEGKAGFVIPSAFAKTSLPSKWSLFGQFTGDSHASERAQNIRGQEMVTELKESIDQMADEVMPTIDSKLIILNISSEPKDKGPGGMDWGWVTIHGIAYFDNFAVLKIENHEYSLDDITLADNKWTSVDSTTGSYFIEDGDNNYKRFALLANRPFTAESGKTGQYLFFEPFQIKHFNLINAYLFNNHNLDTGEHVRGVKVP